MPAFALVLFVAIPALIAGLVLLALVQTLGEDDRRPARDRLR
jgi:hypothetical protein